MAKFKSVELIFGASSFATKECQELQSDIENDNEEGQDVQAIVLEEIEVSRAESQVLSSLRGCHVLQEPDGVVHWMIPPQMHQVGQIVNVLLVSNDKYDNDVEKDI